MGSVGSLDRFQLACPPTVADEAARRAVQVYQAGAAADPEKTANYLTIAAQKARANAAHEEALAHWRPERLPPRSERNVNSNDQVTIHAPCRPLIS